MKDYYSIREFSRKLNVTAQTVRNWERSGKLIPHHRSPSGYRYYSHEQLLLASGFDRPKSRVVIGYCRVSSQKQKDDLERQVQNMTTYLSAKGRPFRIITDIGSGLNYNRKGLLELLDLIDQDYVDQIVVLYKDRLARYGYELIDHLANMHGTSIEIVDMTDKLEQQELVEDLIQIITVFSCRLQGRRRKRTQELLSDLKEGDD